MTPLFALLIWLGVLAHVFLRTQGLLGLRGRSRLALGAAIGVLGLAYVPARILLARGLAEEAARLLELAAVWFMGLAAVLWTLLIPFELAVGAARCLARRRLARASRPFRRGLALGLWAVAAALVLIGWRNARATPELTHLRLAHPGASAQRLAVISDAHLGSISSPDQWRRTLRAARALDPDALLVPGDLIDDHGPRTEPQVALLRETFPDEPIYVTTGNHEYYAGPRSFEELCARHGFVLLRQEVRSLSPSLALAGIDDAHLVAAGKALSGVLPRMEGPAILLTHRPSAAQGVREREQTLVLAGHTHGGQTWPMVLLVALGNSGFRAGRYRVGSAELYVTRGTGVWGPPVRLSAPPELVVIDVVPGPEFLLEELGQAEGG